MSEAFHIISDGSCDLPLELTKEKNITVVPFYVSFEEGKYQKEMVEIGVREFYQKMVDHPDVYPKSSMPSVQDYLDAFLPYVKAGTPIICICITTKFSGSMQSALNAKAILEEEYPESQIYVCDSCVNTVLQGIYVLEAVRLRDAGAGYQESIDRLNEIKSSGRIFFTVGNMEYLKHGGRIGKVASVAGSLLGIKPNEPFMSPKGEVFWARQYGGNVWLYPGWPLDITAKRQELQQAGYSFFARLEENPPSSLPEMRRQGLFNWDGALL